MIKKKKPAPKAKSKRKAKAYRVAAITTIVNRHEGVLVNHETRFAGHGNVLHDLTKRLSLVEESARKAFERLNRLEIRLPGNLVERMGSLESANWRHQERAPILTELEVLQLRVFLAAIKGVRENQPKADRYQGC